MRIALTGGIACGKSLLSKFLNELGVETLDADDVVHELLPDPEERRRIAAEVFADPAKRRALEAKLHPLVKARIDAWLAAHAPKSSNPPISQSLNPSIRQSVNQSILQSSNPNNQTIKQSNNQTIAIIPLLFEVHWEKNFDIICCVVSSREKQIERMTATRGMTRAEAEARLAAQMPVEEKARLSHYVIRNDGTPDDLKAKAAKFVEWLSRRTAE